MTLKLLTVSSFDFDHIRSHLVSHMPNHRNMHLREACQRNKRRDLRYLHSMYAPVHEASVIHGMVSGPDLFVEYRVFRGRLSTQLRVVDEQGSATALDRLSRRFLHEVMRRIQQERTGFEHYPRRSSGQFYLRRGIPGMPATHRACRKAVAMGVLSERFVAVLSEWNLELLHP